MMRAPWQKAQDDAAANLRKASRLLAEAGYPVLATRISDIVLEVQEIIYATERGMLDYNNKEGGENETSKES